MKSTIDDPSRRDQVLAEDGFPTASTLDAWAVPEPSNELADRVVAALMADAPATKAMSSLPPSTRDASGASDPETVTMHATVTDHSPRSFLSPLIIGIAAAAAILLAFWLGRRSTDDVPRATEPGPVYGSTPLVAQPPVVPTPPPADAPASVALPPEVEVTFDVQPRYAAITLHNEQIGPTTLNPLDVLTLRREDGDYQVELVAPDGTRSIVSLVLGPEPTQRFTANMEGPALGSSATTPPARRASPTTSHDLVDPFPPAQSKGEDRNATLRIGTNPGAPPASVRLDGKYLGTTPLPSVQVEAGRHTVEFRWPGGKQVRKIVNVQAEGSLVVKAG